MISVKLFSKCHKYQPTFDDCVKDGLNEARPYFQHGVPEFDIPPFDPFFAEEIIQMRGSQSLNYKLTLRNVYESGWTKSHVYRFKSDLKNGYVQYNQWFPEKFLQGEWEIEYNLMGPYANAGTFNLTLCEYKASMFYNVSKKVALSITDYPLQLSTISFDCTPDLCFRVSYAGQSWQFLIRKLKYLLIT